MANIYMTAEGLQKLKDELVYLEGVERPRVIAAIQEARDKGDLSENAEYDAAKGVENRTAQRENHGRTHHRREPYQHQRSTGAHQGQD